MNEQDKPSRCLTGVQGLDDMLKGGLPKGKIILVCGGPGTGKTILSTQFLYHGAKEYGERGIFVSFAETDVSLKYNMLSLGWNLDELEKKGLIAIHDLSNLIYLSPEEFHKVTYGGKLPEIMVDSTLPAIKNQVKQFNAKRIVIDSITALSVHQPDLRESRLNIAHLFQGLLDTGCTCLITSEIRTSTFDRVFQIEEYIADGVLLLQRAFKGDELIRSIQIEKMRGLDHDMQPRPYYITSNGITVFPRERVIS